MKMNDTMDSYLAHIGKNLRDAPTTRLFTTQLMISTVLGSLAFLTFCILRCRFPNVYMARLNYLSVSNKRFMPPILNPYSLFGWIPTLLKITEQEVIDFAGLDAYVFLGFFKMAIKLLTVCWLFSAIIISPIRYYYTGDFDQGDDIHDGDGNDGDDQGGDGDSDDTDPDSDFYSASKSSDDAAAAYKTYLWVYVVFTYIFTFVTKRYLMEFAKKVIEARQNILGSQDSITDRTIRLSGIPPELRSERALKESIESLDIGKVKSIVICKEWRKLDLMFNQRNMVLHKLEKHWANYLGNKKSDIFNIRPFASSSYPLQDDYNNIDTRYHDTDAETSGAISSDNQQSVATAADSNGDVTDEQIQIVDPSPLDSISDYDYGYSASDMQRGGLGSHSVSFGSATYKKRPQIKLGPLGLFGKAVDAIDYYTLQLAIVDRTIITARNAHYSATPNAFVTMDSVATAQMMAQAVLDPRVTFLITRLAPAPNDIIWENVTLPRKDRVVKIYYITIITGVLAVAFILPVGYLATLLNLKTISKFWPALGKLLKSHEWSARFVTELLPVYIFTLLNFIIPFLYVWLSSKQGFVSHGEEELSVVSKNFFYVFVNLFLVFTMAGTASNYWGYISDSKKLALQLALSLRGLSSFYVDTILLQGIALMPFKLLLMGHIIRFPYFKASCKTPRDYRDLYKPPTFNFGLQLPIPLLILIITLLYSVMSTKILSAGVAYFVIGYAVFKYQLIYSCIHPQHSTGQVMPIIFRRVVMGLLLFQFTVAGSLALSNVYILSMCLIPLPLFTIMFLLNFEKNYLPLSFFIALRAVKDSEANEEAISSGSETANNSGSSRLRHGGPSLQSIKSRTIDERREINQTYEYPYLTQSLDGPWLAIDGEQIIMATHDGTVRKKFTFEEF